MPNLLRRAVISGIALIVLMMPRQSVADDPPMRPHVILIVADDLRADVTSVYRGPVRTPHLERLAARGCVFDRATCGYPICHVSRTELLTGRVVVTEAAPGKAVPIPREWSVWPEVMRKAGWHTVHLGKWHVAGTPANRGYAETAATFSAGGAPGVPLTLPRSATGREVTGYVGWTLKTKENQPRPEWGVGLTPETDARIASGAIELIKAQPRRPLFLQVNFTATHDPLHWPQGQEHVFRPDEIVLPKNFQAAHLFEHGNRMGRDELIVPAPRSADDVRRERAVYYAVVQDLDRQVGRILQALADQGELERSLVIFTSDQGLALGSHGLMGKQNQYEHTIQVPLIIAGPGIPPQRVGQRLSPQCALRDLFPTICQLTGLPVAETVQGRSLVPVLRNEKAEVHDAVFGYFTDTQRMVCTPEGWKLIWYPRAQRTQLFHIPDDPDELKDLSTEPAQRPQLQRLLRRLQEWLLEHRDLLGDAVPMP